MPEKEDMELWTNHKEKETITENRKILQKTMSAMKAEEYRKNVTQIFFNCNEKD